MEHHDCLDTETLAAWADGSLTAAQRAAAEAHAADCDRCLAVLAAIAKTTPPPSEAERPSWFPLRWALPLGAAAVAILAVVLVQNPRTPEPSTTVLPPAAEMAKAPPAVGSEERDAKVESGATTAKAVPTKTEAPAAAESARKQAAPLRSEPAANAAADAADKRIAQERLARDGLVPLPPRPVAAPAASPPLAPVPPVSQSQTTSQFRSARAAPAPEILSPDPNVRWRLAGRSLERSTDAGATWVIQSTGTETLLLAGAAPSANVCWIVGRAATVLLTTDAGGTWRRLEFPDPNADLVAVKPRDELSAIVTAADGRTYRTEDGGRTWVLQENSGTTF